MAAIPGSFFDAPVGGKVRAPVRRHYGSPHSCRCLTDDHVGVGPAEAEGAHPGHATPRRPRAERADHLHRQLAPHHVRVGRPEVEVRRDLVVLQGQDRLDEPGHAGRGLQMSDVRLDRAQQEAALGRPVRGEDGRDRADLDRIAERRAGADEPGRRLRVAPVLGWLSSAPRGGCPASSAPWRRGSPIAARRRHRRRARCCLDNRYEHGRR